MRGAAPAINSRSGSLTGNRTAEFRPANTFWLCLDSLSPSWVRQPSTTATARLPNQTWSDRIVVRFLAVTNDDL
jgi:hypothetical protein